MMPGRNRNNENIAIPIGESILSRHMLFLGGIGTGKTNAMNLFIRNTRRVMTDRDVMVIFDTKGDYYREFYEPGDIVISNDERATGIRGTDYWNIFNEVTADDRIEENVLEIANTLFADKIKNTTQPFFPNAAKDLFYALMMHMIRKDSLKEKRNNKSLRAYLNMMDPELMMKVLDQHKDLKAMKSYIYDPKAGQTLVVMAELQQMVREIFIGNFSKKGSISMRDIVRNRGGQVVFVEYDLSIGSILTPVYRLLIDLAIKETLSRRNKDGSVYFFIDEFRLLPELSHMDDGINFGRSLGAKFFVGIQNINQVIAAYGEDVGRSMLSGFGTTYAFRINDGLSREFIKNLSGMNIKKQTFMSSIQTQGITEQLREAYVVEDSDINNLRIGEAIVTTITGEPFVFRFNEYR
ncbi:MAG: type IV secretion system DNA-binding domain-containing protein [Mogibacterium sp.]|nr:type IV secretion system DNA-binding domain-containing protein [Mogibacterium sp.]